MGDGRNTLHVLQVTDCHLFPSSDETLLGVRTHASFEAVLAAACRQRTPDAVLATGDIAQRPVAETYRLFLATLRRHYAGPLLCAPGNHDHGATLAAELPTGDLTVGGWRLLGVDTHVDDVVGGRVGDAELARLGAAASGGDGHVLVAGHHSPVEIGVPWLDGHRIEDGDALLATLDGAAARVYVFGHIHQEVDTVAGMRLLGTPSTCFQFSADPDGFGIDDASPGARWLELDADGGVATRVLRVHDFPLEVDLADRDNR